LQAVHVYVMCHVARVRTEDRESDVFAGSSSCFCLPRAKEKREHEGRPSVRPACSSGAEKTRGEPTRGSSGRDDLDSTCPLLCHLRGHLPILLAVRPITDRASCRTQARRRPRTLCCSSSVSMNAGLNDGWRRSPKPGGNGSSTHSSGVGVQLSRSRGLSLSNLSPSKLRGLSAVSLSPSSSSRAMVLTRPCRTARR
jgi:hypothetical protein